jgi:hypothetical protein
MKSIEARAADFKRELQPFAFTESMKQEFYDYWSEPNKSNTKMRFEQEKTWDLGRRLARWANNNKDRHNLQKTDSGYRVIQEAKVPETDLEKLDYELMMYRLNFEKIPFNEMHKWYDYLKENKMLKRFDKEDVSILRAAYGDDNLKCRCACVQWTFDWLIREGRNFTWLKSQL